MDSRSDVQDHSFDDSVFGQAGYMEMFEHGRRVLDAIDRLRPQHSEGGAEFRLELPVEHFFAARKLTHTNQSPVLAVFSMLGDEAGDPSS